MGANFDHIDGVFRNKLKDFSRPAPDGMWDTIEYSLSSRKSVKRFKFYKIAATIVTLVVIGSTLLYISNNKLDKESFAVSETFNNQEQIKNEVIEKEIREENLDSGTSKEKHDKQPHTREPLLAKAEPAQKSSEQIVIKEKIEPFTEDKRQEKLSRLEKLENVAISLNLKSNKPQLIDVRENKVESIIYSLPNLHNFYALNEPVETHKDEKQKWTIGGEFSPLYSYRHIAETGGSYDKDYYNDSENAIMSYTGGINVQYKAIDRLTIQAGVYYTTMGQSFDYVAVYANAAYDMVSVEHQDRFINSYNISNSLGNVSFNSPYVVIDEKLGRVSNFTDSKGSPDVSDPIYSDLNAEIQQNFQYVEVPFLLRYKLIDKNIDLNLIGGVGANFLIGNDVYLKYGGNKEIIGETQGVSTVNYNGTLGLGIEYPLMNRLNLRLEPSVKYYINEINSSSSVQSHPYSVGIYTGINYSF